jgi:predicted nucleic acid-binding protein
MLRRHRIAIDQVTRAMRVYDSIPIRYVDVEIEAALGIASSLGIYAYDAYLLRCAERYNASLLTLDRGLQRAALAWGVDILEMQP